jgi:uncharacterized protein YneF (UPF0154 family)
MEIKIKIIFIISWIVISLGTGLFFGHLSEKCTKKYWFENDSYLQGKMIRNISLYKNIRNISFSISLFVFVIIILCL